MATFVENINKLADGLPPDLLESLDTIQSDIDSIQTKLDTVEVGANNYTHPATHPVSIIDGSLHPSMIVKTDAVGVVGFGSVSWSEIDGKPIEYTPAAHVHGDTDITSVDWSKIINEPTVYPPSQHTHSSEDISGISWTSIINKPTQFYPASHTHGDLDITSVDWSKIQNEPTEYPPSTHLHTDDDIESVKWEKLTGKPTEFTPVNHTHNSSDILGVEWNVIDNKPASYPPSPHHHDITDVVTGNLSATRINETSELQFVTNDEKLIIAGAELSVNRGANGGYVPLDMNGKIPTSYMPSISVIDVFTVTSEAEMLALSATQGDIALRQDTNAQFMLQAIPATSIDNWVQLVTSAGVTSVNGQVGIVSLDTSTISEGSNLYYTAARVQTEISNAHDTTGTLTNKTLDSHLNKIGANHIHYKVKATENLAVGDVVKIIGYQNGEDAIRVAKTTSLSDVAIGVVEQSIIAGEFGLVVNTGTVDGIDTTAWTFGTILYSDGAGGFTDVKPTTDTYQACGYTMRVNAGDGSLLVEFTEPRDNFTEANISSLEV